MRDMLPSKEIVIDNEKKVRSTLIEKTRLPEELVDVVMKYHCGRSIFKGCTYHMKRKALLRGRVREYHNTVRFIMLEKTNLVKELIDVIIMYL